MIKSIEFIEKKYLFLYNYKHVIFMFQMLQIDSLIKVFFYNNKNHYNIVLNFHNSLASNKILSLLL